MSSVNRSITSASELVRRASTGEETVENVARRCLEQISRREGTVAAWEFLDSELVLYQARMLDGIRVRGPLHGLPVGIKDTIDTKDMPTAYGSPIYGSHRPVADAACVALLRAAGALIIGKTVTTEFAATKPGKTRNPFNTKRTPGGSSSGSAAAVGAGMVPAALASQTMGSLIRPAAYCGAVGYKPSFATINRVGVKPQAESLDTLGVIGRSLADTALITSVLITGEAAYFDARAPRPPRIVLYRGPDWSKAEGPAVDALDDAATALAKAGAEVQEIEPPQILRDAFDAQIPYVFYEMARGLSDEWLTRRSAISSNLAPYIEIGFKVSFGEFLEAEKVVFAARRWMSEAFQSADLWLTISAAGEAPSADSTGDISFNRLWSLLHLPAITLPVGNGPAGLPLGVQLIGPYRRDRDFVAWGHWVEERLSHAIDVPSNGLSST